MERNYWLQRKRSHVSLARSAARSDTRLIHLDLAGRYAIKAAAGPLSYAMFAGKPAAELLADGNAAADAGANLPSYEHLEIGARWLAARTENALEREVHLGMASRYARLQTEAAAGEAQ